MSYNKNTLGEPIRVRVKLDDMLFGDDSAPVGGGVRHKGSLHRPARKEKSLVIMQIQHSLFS